MEMFLARGDEEQAAFWKTRMEGRISRLPNLVVKEEVKPSSSKPKEKK